MKDATLTDVEAREVARQYLAHHPKVTIGWLTLPDAIKMNGVINYWMYHYNVSTLDELISVMRAKGELSNVRGVKRVDATLRAVERKPDKGEDLGSLVESIGSEVRDRLG